MDKPTLRMDIQVMARIVNGRRMIVFHDPLELGENIALDMKLLPMLNLLDGNHDLQEIQIELIRRHQGGFAALSDVKTIVETLDQCCLLDGEHYRRKVSVLHDQFSSQSVRHSVHAGKSYPAEPDALRRFVAQSESDLTTASPGRGRKISGILAPHIDIQVARKSYGGVYRSLRERAYDLVLIFGINHQIQDGLYCVSDKDYETPLGVLDADREFVAELRRRVPPGTLARTDFGHKMEHSIEFQTVFLRYYLGARAPIVPILCGSIHRFILDRRNLFADERFFGMVEAIGGILEERKADVLLIAGVDFSHVGLKFGDPSPAGSILGQAVANDREILSCLGNGDAEGIFSNAVSNGDRFRVCGLPSMLIFTRLLQGCRGEVVSYETFDEKATGSAVNYASMIFTKKN